jgi:Uma2 family endonuclease
VTLPATRPPTYDDILALPDNVVENVVVPDLAGWWRERMPEPPVDAFFTLPPDWVCEVLSASASTSRTDRTKKLLLYARTGVPHLWLLDPVAQTLEVYSLEAGRWVLIATHGGQETIRTVPFEMLALDLGRLWGIGGQTR